MDKLNEDIIKINKLDDSNIIVDLKLLLENDKKLKEENDRIDELIQTQDKKMKILRDCMDSCAISCTSCTGCTGTCSTACDGGCSNTCSSCTGCAGTCTTSCSSTCTHSCDSSCSGH